MKVTLHLTGNRPMLQHNGRLANPIDPYTRALKAITGKRKKTDDDLFEIMKIEARGAAYETPDGYLALPTQNVWRCVYDAATAFKRGADVKRALLPLANDELLLVDGAPVKVDEYLSDSANIFYAPVAVNRAKAMRSRPIIRNWSATHHFELLDDVIDVGDLAPIVARAGRLVGVGDWRPMHGTFDCQVETS